MFGGAYLRREICVSKSIGLAFLLEVNLPFLLCFTFYLRTIFQVQAPGGLYLEGRYFTEGCLRYQFEGLIFGGAYFRNFRVFHCIRVYRFVSQRKKQVVIEQTLIS